MLKKNPVEMTNFVIYWTNEYTFCRTFYFFLIYERSCFCHHFFFSLAFDLFIRCVCYLPVCFVVGIFPHRVSYYAWFRVGTVCFFFTILRIFFKTCLSWFVYTLLVDYISIQCFGCLYDFLVLSAPFWILMKQWLTLLE